MLAPQAQSVVPFPADQEPLLLVIVDTEEEFDWGRPFSRDSTRVTTVRNQARAHRVFERYQVTPVYVIDYPVASQAQGYGPLKELLEAGCCEIGAHLQPWVNPPFTEVLCEPNSFPCNLPPELERRKAEHLTRAIEDNLGVRPAVYKAGRYGVGPATPGILASLGYHIDVSVMPHTDLRPLSGPDFRRCSARPYWCGADATLLEIPLTVGYTGLLGARGTRLYPRVAGPGAVRLHLPGVLARLGLLERTLLSPEGATHEELRRLTEALLRSGHRVFSLTYHSPSLAPGHTPYVRSQAELSAFLERIERYLDYFTNEVGGRPATTAGVRALADALRAAPTQAHPP